MSNLKTSPKWKQTGAVPGPARPGPVVKVTVPTLDLVAVEVGVYAIYPNSDRRNGVKDDLKHWGREAKAFEGSEWVAGRENNEVPAVVLGDSPIEPTLTLHWPVMSMVQGSLTIEATLREGSAAAPALLSSTTFVPFTTEDGKDVFEIETRIDRIKFPDAVGRYTLELSVTGTPIVDPSDFRFSRVVARIPIYTIDDDPFDPDSDSADPDFEGASLPGFDTGTGTPVRFQKLMSLLGPSFNHRTTTAAEMRELIWRIHTGINDFSSPPFFNPLHDIHLTVNGEETKHLDSNGVVVGGDPLEVAEQWLMWVPTTTRPPWNSAACIGYVQLFKTMAAAVGIFVRRAWVLPHTLQMPDGKTIPFVEADMWCLGEEDTAKKQKASVTIPGKGSGRTRSATLVLMEPNRSGENFEACLYTPDHRFLPGGYRTSSLKSVPSFEKDVGFKSALEVLLWWCKTKRGSFQRFMCWADIDNLDDDGKPTDFWDRDGKHYDAAHYEDIVKGGKEVPPPPLPSKKTP